MPETSSDDVGVRAVLGPGGSLWVVAVDMRDPAKATGEDLAGQEATLSAVADVAGGAQMRVDGSTSAQLVTAPGTATMCRFSLAG